MNHSYLLTVESEGRKTRARVEESDATGRCEGVMATFRIWIPGVKRRVVGCSTIVRQDLKG